MNKRWIIIAKKALLDYEKFGEKALECLRSDNKEQLSNYLLKRTLAFQRYCRMETLVNINGCRLEREPALAEIWQRIDKINIDFSTAYSSQSVAA